MQCNVLRIPVTWWKGQEIDIRLYVWSVVAWKSTIREVQFSWSISSTANPGYSCPNDAKFILVEPKLLVSSRWICRIPDRHQKKKKKNNGAKPQTTKKETYSWPSLRPLCSDHICYPGTQPFSHTCRLLQTALQTISTIFKAPWIEALATCIQEAFQHKATWILWKCVVWGKKWLGEYGTISIASTGSHKFLATSQDGTFRCFGPAMTPVPTRWLDDWVRCLAVWWTTVTTGLFDRDSL